MIDRRLTPPRPRSASRAAGLWRAIGAALALVALTLGVLGLHTPVAAADAHPGTTVGTNVEMRAAAISLPDAAGRHPADPAATAASPATPATPKPGQAGGHAAAPSDLSPAMPTATDSCSGPRCCSATPGHHLLHGADCALPDAVVQAGDDGLTGPAPSSLPAPAPRTAARVSAERGPPAPLHPLSLTQVFRV